jgi:hypothetical protein
VSVGEEYIVIIEEIGKQGVGVAKIRGLIILVYLGLGFEPFHHGCVFPFGNFKAYVSNLTALKQYVLYHPQSMAILI